MIEFWHSVKYVDCMKTLLHIVFVVAIGLSAHVAEAQEPQVMSLHDCMEYAISNSTKVRIQEAASGDARLDRRDAALALFTPQISAQTYAYYNFGRSIDPQTNTYFNTTSFHNNYGVSAGYDLFDGFKAVNNYKISKTGMLIADSCTTSASATCMRSRWPWLNKLLPRPRGRKNWARRDTPTSFRWRPI